MIIPLLKKVNLTVIAVLTLCASFYYFPVSYGYEYIFNGLLSFVFFTLQGLTFAILSIYGNSNKTLASCGAYLFILAGIILSINYLIIIPHKGKLDDYLFFMIKDLITTNCISNLLMLAGWICTLKKRFIGTWVIGIIYTLLNLLLPLLHGLDQSAAFLFNLIIIPVLYICIIVVSAKNKIEGQNNNLIPVKTQPSIQQDRQYENQQVLPQTHKEIDVDRLYKLKELHNAGVISNEEFEAEKNRILGR